MPHALRTAPEHVELPGPIGRETQREFLTRQPGDQAPRHAEINLGGLNAWHWLICRCRLRFRDHPAPLSVKQWGYRKRRAKPASHIKKPAAPGLPSRQSRRECRCFGTSPDLAGLSKWFVRRVLCAGRHGHGQIGAAATPCYPKAGHPPVPFAPSPPVCVVQTRQGLRTGEDRMPDETVFTAVIARALTLPAALWPRSVFIPQSCLRSDSAGS